MHRWDTKARFSITYLKALHLLLWLIMQKTSNFCKFSVFCLDSSSNFQIFHLNKPNLFLEYVCVSRKAAFKPYWYSDLRLIVGNPTIWIASWMKVPINANIRICTALRAHVVNHLSLILLTLIKQEVLILNDNNTYYKLIFIWYVLKSISTQTFFLEIHIKWYNQSMMQLSYVVFIHQMMLEI